MVSKGVHMRTTKIYGVPNWKQVFDPDHARSNSEVTENSIDNPPSPDPRIQELGKQIATALIQMGECEQAEQLDRALIHYQRSAFHIVFCGEFNRGKSTLVSGLLGSVRLPSKLSPTTAYNCHIQLGDESNATIVFKSGQRLRQSLEQLDEWTLSCHTPSAAEVSHIEIQTQTKILEDHRVLVDTPGSQEHLEQSQKAKAAMEDADFVIVVLDARQLLGEHDQQLIRHIHSDLGKPVAVVINFINYFVDESEQREAMSQVRRWWESHVDKDFDKWCFQINCLAAARNPLTLKDSGSDDFVKLQRILVSLDQVTQTRIRSNVRLHRIRATADWLASQQSEKVSLLEHQIDDLETTRADRDGHRHRSIEQFERFASVEKERLVARAAQLLDLARDKQCSAFRSTGVEWVKCHAYTYFVNAVKQVLSEIEQEGSEISAKLAEQAFTTAGHLRFDVKDQHVEMDSPKPRSISRKHADEKKFQGILAGAIIGAPIGFVCCGFEPMGIILGAALGAIFGIQTGDVEEATIDAECYAQAAHQSWTGKRSSILNCLTKAIDSEIRRFRNDLERHLQGANDGDQLERHVQEVKGRSELLNQINDFKSVLECEA